MLITLHLCILCGSQNKQQPFALYCINWLVFITEMESVYCAVVGCLSEYVPQICLFQRWRYFLVWCKTSGLGTTLHKCWIIRIYKWSDVRLKEFCCVSVFVFFSSEMVLENSVITMRSVLFWDFMQCWLVVSYWCFGKTNWFHLWGLSSWPSKLGQGEEW